MSILHRTTKIQVPDLRSDTLQRDHLLRRLNTDWKVASLVAPGGYGKTLLATSWLRASNRPCAWLTLEEADSEPQRLASLFFAAAARAHECLGFLATILAEGPNRLEMATTAFVNMLVEADLELAIVLDDFHLLDDTKGALSWASRLLEAAPASMQMMICSRQKPALPLAAARVARDLVELGSDALRFDLAEIDAILRQHEVIAPDRVLCQLDEKTRGWPAAVRLAAILAQERGAQASETFLDSFHGNQAYVAEYLTEEVCRGLEADLQEFLVAVSVLRELHGPLCHALTGRADSTTVLTKLSSSNLLLSPVDESGRWFRCHPLLRHFFRRRLEPDQAREMNRRAAAWFRQNDGPESAIEHAIRAGAWSEACSVLTEIGDLYSQNGQPDLVLRWLDKIPSHERTSRPRVALVHAWALMLGGQMEPCARCLAEVESVLQGSPVRATEAGILTGIRAAVAVMTGDPTAAIGLARRSLDLLPDQEIGWRGKITLGLGLSLRHLDRLEDARLVLSEAATLLEESKNQAVNLARTELADILVDQGELIRADRMLRDRVQFEEGSSGPPVSPLLTQATASLGSIQYEWNRLDQAEAWASRSLQLAPGWRAEGGDMAVAGWALRCRIAVARADRAAALEALEQLASIAATSDLPTSRLELEVHRGRFWIASGERSRLEEWVDASSSCEQLPTPLRDRLNLLRAHARILCATDRSSVRTAIRTLRDLGRGAESSGRQVRLAKVLALSAIALDRSNETTSALDTLGKSLAIGQRIGLIRTFADLGDPLNPLLLRLWQSRDPALSSVALSAYLAELLVAVGEDAPDRPVSSTERAAPLEALTPRELDVLRLFERGLTNSDAAATLGITTGTVKRHASNLFEKLGCHSRGRAVADARRLGIL